MATAGRTVLVSGTLICLSLASLLIFPQVFLRSMGLGGIAGVLLAMTGALTVLPRCSQSSARASTRCASRFRAATAGPAGQAIPASRRGRPWPGR